MPAPSARESPRKSREGLDFTTMAGKTEMVAVTEQSCEVQLDEDRYVGELLLWFRTEFSSLLR